MKRLLCIGACSLICVGSALATLPAPDDAAKAKAAEAAAKNAWQGKLGAYQLCKSQDKVVALWKSSAAARSAASSTTPPGATSPDKAAPAAAPVSAAAAALPPSPCADPGPFAYNPPAEKPLETSGAHSPSGTAATPPSVKQPSAQLAPAGKS